MQSNNNEDDVIDLMELFLQILSHWLIIGITAVLTGVIALVISKFYITPQYRSTAEIYVQGKDGISSLQDIQLGSGLTSDYAVIVGCRPILDQVIENLELDETFKSLSKKLTIENPSNTRILKISVTDGDPELAKKIVDEIADIAVLFIPEKMDQKAPKVIHYGYSDEPKVSPSVAKNSIIGALIGAFLVIAVITVIYLVNDTIIDPEDFEKKLGINLLGTLPYDKKQSDHAGEKVVKKIGGKKSKNKKEAKGRA